MLALPNFVRRGSRAFQVLLALALSVLFTLGALRGLASQAGILKVQDHQVTVATDYLRGRSKADAAPGYRTFLPWFQEVHVFDKRPVEYIMQGAELRGWNHVPRLVVRASDGSSYWFDYVSIQYALDSSGPLRALEDTGPGDGYKNGLVNAFARSILRDEYGKFTAQEIVLPQNLRQAKESAKARLSTVLADHGVTVLEISVSKPGFAEAYEATIERRKVAEQDIDSIERTRERVQAEKDQRLEHIQHEKRLALERAQEVWGRKLADLQRQNAELQADRDRRLNEIRVGKALQLDKSRALWEYELEELRHESAKLGAGRAERLEAIRREKRLALEKERGAWERELMELERARVELEASRAERLASVVREKKLALESGRVQWEAQLVAAEAEAASVQHAADAKHADRLLLGELDRASMQGQAEARTESYEKEAEGFLARSEALAAQGALAVRAALIEKLRSIRIEITTFKQDASFDGERTASAR